MDLHVWTDGTSTQSVLLCNSVILTEDTFLKRIINVTKVTTTYEAEVLSVTQAIEYLHTVNLEPYDKIIVFTDAQTVVARYYELKSGKRSLNEIKYKRMWTELMNLIDGLPLSVEMVHYFGHSSEHNPNKLCDITGKIVSKCITAT